jgi:hypothetical protein
MGLDRSAGPRGNLAHGVSEQPRNRQGNAMTLSNDSARCVGHGVGPSGHQNRADCVNCVRRTAPRPAGDTWFMDPPVAFPCPMKIYPAQADGAGPNEPEPLTP